MNLVIWPVLRSVDLVKQESRLCFIAIDKPLSICSSVAIYFNVR